MNENLDLTKILDGCPEGTKFYSSDFGEVTFFKVSSHDWEWYPIWLHYRSKVCSQPQILSLTKKGQNVYGYDGNALFSPLKTNVIGPNLKGSGTSQKLRSLTQKHCSRLIKY